MTTINPIGGTATNQPVDSTFQSRMQQAMAPVASLFGETPDQLMQELNSGKTSLSALAAQKGISQTDLQNAITQGLQATSSSSGQSLSATQLSNIADRIANQRHGGHHHHHGGGGGGVSGAQTTTNVPDPTTSSTSATTPASSTTSATTTANEELLQLLEGQTTADQTTF